MITFFFLFPVQQKSSFTGKHKVMYLSPYLYYLYSLPEGSFLPEEEGGEKHIYVCGGFCCGFCVFFLISSVWKLYLKSVKIWQKLLGLTKSTLKLM